MIMLDINVFATRPVLQMRGITWPGMYTEIRGYIQNCVPHQKNQPSLKHNHTTATTPSHNEGVV